MVFFFYKNKGILVPLYVIVSVIGASIVSKLLKEYEFLNAKYDFQIVFGIGLIISGLWTYLTSKDFIVVKGQKERIYFDNSFFFLSMGLWSYILAVGGLLTLISGLTETFVE